MKNINNDLMLNTEYFSPPPRDFCGCAVTVGNFDGVHLGHRRLLELLKEQAEQYGGLGIVLSFSQSSFKKNGGRLASEEKKRELLKEYAQGVCFADFLQICSMSPAEFVTRVLRDGLGARCVVCGYDFRFGKDRSGDTAMLESLCRENGIAFVKAEPFFAGDTPVSSTMIRGLLSKGEVRRAGELLGREFCFSAPIIYGNRIGRTLGLPTINQEYPCDFVSLPHGVYAVKCRLEGRQLFGVANLGTKPTVSDRDTVLCETHIFDFCGNVYEKQAEISFVEFLRPEKKFDSLQELSAQAVKDAEKAKQILFGE